VKNIVLIGFMGVGKGTVAREIYKIDKKRVAIDTDDLIESMENRKIREIFESEGEEYFRECERRVAKWLRKSVKNSIISTGGGFYKVKNLKKIGKIVLLNASFEYIHNQILSHPNSQKKLSKRPLFKDPIKAKELYETRLPKYKKVADIVIDIEGKTPTQIANEILNL
jgi:shikimate kinase